MDIGIKYVFVLCFLFELLMNFTIVCKETWDFYISSFALEYKRVK